MQKWEHLEIEVVRVRVGETRIKAVNGQQIPSEKRQDFYAYMNELGRQGWELVTAIDYVTYYFKRAIE